MFYLFEKATDLVEVATVLEHEDFAFPLEVTGSLDRTTRVRTGAVIEGSHVTSNIYNARSRIYRNVLVLFEGSVVGCKNSFHEGLHSLLSIAIFISSDILQSTAQHECQYGMTKEQKLNTTKIITSCYAKTLTLPSRR